MIAIAPPKAITNSGLIFIPLVSSSKNRNRPALDAGSAAVFSFFLELINFWNISTEGLYKNLD